MLTIVSDFDGTLCFDGRTVRDEIVEALVSVHREHRLVIASARPPRDLLPVLPEALQDVTVIGGNGAFVRPAGAGIDGIETVHFEAEVRASIAALVEEFDLTSLVDGEWDYAYTGDGTDEVIAKVHTAGSARNVVAAELAVWTKALLFTDDPIVVERLRRLPVVVNAHGTEAVVDVAPTGITKAAAVARLGIDDFVAFGNDQNDRSLFAAARHSVCVGEHPVGELASERVAPDGVAEALLRVCELAPQL